MTIETFTDEIANGTVDQIQNTRQNRFTHVLLLRETTSQVRLTTDGETINTMKVRTGDPEQATISQRVVDMFNRKQPGAERRIAKSVQRDLIGDLEHCDDDLMHPNDMNQNSVESVLFGSAAGDQKVSQRSRVYYNSAYSIRSAKQTVQRNTQNASADENRQPSKEGQGTWTPGFVKPGTCFPAIITFDSCTPEEVLFGLAVLSRTTRYGANESRGGNMTNHFLGVYAGHSDGPANLEVAQLTAGLLAGERYTEDELKDIVTGGPLDIATTRDTVTTAYETLLDRRGLSFETVDRETTTDVVMELRDDDQLTEILETQHKKTQDYVTRCA